MSLLFCHYNVDLQFPFRSIRCDQLDTQTVHWKPNWYYLLVHVHVNVNLKLNFDLIITKDFFLKINFVKIHWQLWNALLVSPSTSGSTSNIGHLILFTFQLNTLHILCLFLLNKIEIFFQVICFTDEVFKSKVKLLKLL